MFKLAAGTLFILGLLSWSSLEAMAVTWSSPVAISEFMANPELVEDKKGEWLEIGNYSLEAQDLSQWRLIVNGKELLLDNTVLAGRGYWVICKEKDQDLNGGVVCDWEWESLSLTNTGGSLGLINDQGETLTFEYPAQLVESGRSTELIEGETWENGEDDFGAEAYSRSSSWAVVRKQNSGGYWGTPGEANAAQAPRAADFAIELSEIFANPEGTDSRELEFLELFNPNPWAVNLEGWILENKKGERLVLGAAYELLGDDYLVLGGDELGFSLYNSDFTVTLLDPVEKQVDKIDFSGNALEGLSYNKKGEKQWWALPSPGKKAGEAVSLDPPGVENKETAQKKLEGYPSILGAKAGSIENRKKFSALIKQRGDWDPVRKVPLTQHWNQVLVKQGSLGAKLKGFTDWGKSKLREVALLPV